MKSLNRIATIVATMFALLALLVGSGGAATAATAASVPQAAPAALMLPDAVHAPAMVEASDVPNRLRVRNMGRLTAVVCDGWNFWHGEKSSKTCPNARRGTLKTGEESRHKLGWQDVDAIAVPSGYSLYRQMRFFSVRAYYAGYGCVYKVKKGRTARYVKVSPSPNYTGSFATRGNFMLLKNGAKAPKGVYLKLC